jgi:hypothetical protein
VYVICSPGKNSDVLMVKKKTKGNRRVTIDFESHPDLFQKLEELEKRYRIGKSGVMRMVLHRFPEGEGEAIEHTPIAQEPKREKRRVEEKITKVESNPYGLGPDDDDFAEL